MRLLRLTVELAFGKEAPDPTERKDLDATHERAEEYRGRGIGFRIEPKEPDDQGH